MYTINYSPSSCLLHILWIRSQTRITCPQSGFRSSKNHSQPATMNSIIHYFNQNPLNVAYVQKDTFYNAVRPIIIGANILGMMPISGIFNRDIRKLSFKWYSLGTMFWIANILWIFFNIGLGTHWVFVSGLGLQSMGNACLENRYQIE